MRWPTVIGMKGEEEKAGRERRGTRELARALRPFFASSPPLFSTVLIMYAQEALKLTRILPELSRLVSLPLAALVSSG